jgi:phosphoglycolate phosphatase
VTDSPGIVLFDLDGTLTDSRPGILRTTRYALRRLNEATGGSAPIPEESTLDYMIGPPLRDTFAKMVGPNLVEPMMGFYRERYQETGLFENAVYEGVPEALETLRSGGYRLFVATSKNEADARRILDHFGLAQYLAEIYGAQNDGGRAIKSELIGYLLEREGISASAEKVAMIGDRKYDVLGAKAVGISALGALWGYGAREELTLAGADALIETPRQIPAIVERVLSKRKA